MKMNMTLLTDLYQLTMVGGYYLLVKKTKKPASIIFSARSLKKAGFA